MVQVALAVFPGVSIDECEAFSLVLGRNPEVEFVGVGEAVGTVPGIGGVEYVDRTYAEVAHPDVVLVPGGLGCRQTAQDSELGDWLRRVEPRCRWLVASSTGTVVVAAAGLLEDRPATTHWLAAPLLAAYGVDASSERIVESGRIITCEGRVTAVDVALLVTARLFGRDAVRRVRDDLGRPDRRRARVAERVREERAARRRPGGPGPGRWGLDGWDRLVRWVQVGRDRDTRGGPGRPRNPELQVSEWVELDLVEMDVDDDRRPSS